MPEMNSFTVFPSTKMLSASLVMKPVAASRLPVTVTLAAERPLCVDTATQCGAAASPHSALVLV